MKIQESVKVPTAKHVITKKPSVDASHITTQGFLTPQPIFIKECVPNMRFDVTCESFTRLNPMPVPTFGRCNVSNRAFFVPFRTIMPKFNEFIEAEPVWHNASNQFGMATGVPVINNTDFVQYFLTYGSVGTSGSSYDFTDGNSYYNFDKHGRFAYKLLQSLGYQVVFDPNFSLAYSAMPLLAWAKVFLDWYYPSAYVNDQLSSKIQALLDDDSLSQSLSYLDLADIVGMTMYCSYNDDYFVSAWDNPVGPNSGAEHSISMPDITNNYPFTTVTGSSSQITGIHVTNQDNANGTPSVNSDYLASGSTNTNQISYRLNQYIVDTLKSLTDYTKRHQMAGVRTVDRYLAEYGVNLSSEIMKRSVYLGSDSFDINFMDVMSMADTSQSGSSDGDVLGAYAGKGVGYGNKRFSYDLGQEFGYFIIVNSIIPDVGYFQGVDRQNLHVTALDFYHGDFDNQGVQAILKPELYLPVNNNGYFTSSYADDVFGFIPRYAEYKVLKSKLSGLYTCGSSNLGMDSYYMYRDCANGNPSAIGHDRSFVRGSDGQQYQRIFYNAKTDEDQFNFIHHFVLTSVDDMLPLWDTYEFKDEDEHEKVTIHPNGSKLN